MKKFLKWLKEDVINIVIVIMLVIAIAVAVIIAKALIGATDYEAATTADYNYLYEQLPILEKQGLNACNNLEDIKVTIQKKYIQIESKQCALIMEIDAEGNFIENSRQDKALKGLDMIATAMASVAISFLIGLLMFFVEVLIWCFGEWCLKKFWLLKKKRES